MIKLSVFAALRFAFACFTIFLIPLAARGDSCACAKDEIRVYCEHNLEAGAVTVTFNDKGLNPFFLPQPVEREKIYAIEVSIDLAGSSSMYNSSGERVLLSFPHCSVEYTEDETPTDNSIWIRRSSVELIVSETGITRTGAEKIHIRITDACSDHAAGTATAGSGPGTTACGGAAEIKVQPAEYETQINNNPVIPPTLGQDFNISSVPVAPGMGVEIPMGFASTKYGFRSAGRISAYGPISPSFASPQKFVFNRITEVDSQVTSGSPLPEFTGRIEFIQHLVPQGVFRIRGWNGNPCDVRDASGSYAAGTLIEVFDSLANLTQPHSFYRIEPSGNGVKIVQSNHGVVRERTIEAPSALMVTDIEGARITALETDPGDSLFISGAPLSERKYDVLRVVQEGPVVVSSTKETFKLEGVEFLRTRHDDGALETLTTYDFASRPKSIQRSDGSWSSYEYDWQTVTEFGPWLSSLPGTGMSVKTVSLDSLYERSTRAAIVNGTVEVGLLSYSRSKTEWDTGITENYDAGVPEVLEKSIGYNEHGVLIYRNHMEFNPRWAGRPRLVWDEYGKGTRYTYQVGEWDGTTFIPCASWDLNTEKTDVRILKETGRVNIPEEGPPSPLLDFWSVPGQSTSEETIYTSVGVVKQVVDGVTTLFNYEPTGLRRLTGKSVNGFVVSKTEYDTSPYVTRESGDDGSYVETEVDIFGRVVRSTTSGDAVVPPVTTRYQYAGLTVTTKVNDKVVSIETRDIAGRVVSQKDATGAETSTAYSTDGKAVTQTAPGFVTTVSKRHSDGRMQSITGSGVIPQFFTYQPGGMAVVTQTNIGSPGGPRWFSSATSSGVVVSESRPNPDASSYSPVVTGYRYATGVSNPVEVLTKVGGHVVAPAQVSLDPSKEPDQEIRLSALLGNYSISGLSIDGDGPEVKSSDRVSSAVRSYVTLNGVLARQTVEKTYHTAGQDVGYTRTSVEALMPVAVNRSGLGSGARWVSTTVIGNTTVTTHRDVFFNSAATVVSVDDSSTSVSPDSVTITRHGKTVSSSTYGGDHPETMVYDASGRLWKHTSATGALTTYNYNSRTGQLDSVRDHEGRITRYVYHPPADPAAGRLWKTTNPENETTETLYNKRGQMVETHGTGTYHVKYDYDEYGAMNKMWSFRTNSPTGDLTQWVYYPGTGLLHKKIDALNRETEYTYYPSGKLKSRTWARAGGSPSARIKTNYFYGNGFNDLTAITYTDGTPSVSIVPDRLGRPKTITDASGIRTHEYHPVTGALDRVSYGQGGPLANLALDYSFHADPNGDNSLRPSGYSVSGGGPVSVWDYDAAGRLETVTSGGYSHTHSYIPGTGVLATLQTWSAASTVLTRSLSHDNMLRLRGIETKNGADVVLSRHGYQLDGAGRRTKATRENGQWWDYHYDDLGQVQYGKKRFPGANGDVIPGHDFQYAYDGIGNRLSAVEGGTGTATTGTSVAYTPNALNQYAAISTEGGRFILGEAQEGSSVTVNDVPIAPADRAGGLGFFWKQLGGTNSTSPLWSNDTVTGSGSPAVTGHIWTPKASFSPTFDEDGNLKSDGRWDYLWDAENRLASMTPTTAAVSAGVPHQRLDFVYDSQGRRVAKTVSNYSGTLVNGSNWVPVTSHRYLYDGWNLIAEYSASDATSTALTLNASHTWGIDLSGTMQGAGAVGGLLCSTLNSQPSTPNCFPSYDGNGNISAWIGASGTVLASMDYSPFGRLVTQHKYASGNVVSRLNFGFSTKYTDAESGLLYYGYRYYDTFIGRWLGRDPIGERGGFQLFAYCINNSVNRIDWLGLDPTVKEQLLQHIDKSEEDYFEKNYPDHLELAKKKARAGIKGMMMYAICKKKQFYGEIWKGGTELSVFPDSWSTEDSEPNNPDGSLFMDNDLGGRRQSWFEAAAKLGKFTFRAKPQFISPYKSVDYSDLKQRPCTKYYYKFTLEVRDNLGVPLPGFESLATRAKWEVEDSVTCCGSKCEFYGGKFQW